MLRRTLSTVAIVLIGIGWFIWLRPLPFGGTVSYVIVSGVSMEPTLYEGDLVLTKQHNQYEIGDIIAFHAEGGLVIHRIVGTSEEGYVVQGDNKDLPDLWHPTEEEILGKKWLHLPHVGRWLDKLREPMILAIVAAVFTLFIMLGSESEQTAAQPGVFDRLWLFIAGYVSGSKKDFRALWRKARRPVEENLEYIEYQSFRLSDNGKEQAPPPERPLDEVSRFVRFHAHGFIRDVQVLWQRFKQERHENQ